MSCDHSRKNRSHSLLAVARALEASGGLGIESIPLRSLSYWKTYLLKKCRNKTLPCNFEGPRGRQIVIKDEHLSVWFGDDLPKLQMVCRARKAVPVKDEIPRSAQCLCARPHEDPKYRCHAQARCVHRKGLHSLSAVAPLFGVSRNALIKRTDLPNTRITWTSVTWEQLKGRKNKKVRELTRVLVTDAQIRTWIERNETEPLFNNFQGPRPTIPDGPTLKLACGYVLNRIEAP